mmetsp:Transcript_41097/g.86338  ORF Transcript_41097/g.86338 Transcript_41097/m.86338 type:complete len:348 (+) Transcript_41097:567-1610(+)
MSLHPTHRNGSMISHNLRTYHGQCLTLGRIDFPWHNGTSRFVWRKANLAQPTSWTGSQHSYIIGNLIQSGGKGTECTGYFNQRIVRRQCLKEIGRRSKWQTGMVGNLCCNRSGISLGGIQSGSHGGTSQSETHQCLRRCFNSLYPVFDLLRIRREFLTERQWRGILAVRPSDLDNLVELLAFRFERVEQYLKTGDGTAQYRDNRCNVHRCGEGIVRALAHVAMIIRMDGILAPHLTSQNHNGTVRQHLIHIHIRLRSASRLINHQWELIIVLPAHNLIGRLSNRIGYLLGQLPPIGLVAPIFRTAFFNERLRVHDFHGHATLPAANGEVLDGSLRLGAPETSGWDGE